MTGGSKPLSRQMRRIASAISALAMCAQFQVSRKCTSWTAAIAIWAASVAALGGRASAVTSAEASEKTSPRRSSSGKSASTASRSRAASGSPAAASSRTNWEMNISKSKRRRAHHSRVICCCLQVESRFQSKTVNPRRGQLQCLDSEIRTNAAASNISRFQ